MIITLIGYRGTGKSSVAPALARCLEWDAVDADVELEQSAGRTIREIFETDGEPEFRRWERDTLIQLFARSRLVIAAGGGAVLNAETRSDMRRAGPVIWLQADVRTIAQRLERDAATEQRRPSLTGRSILEEIADVLSRREPLYRETADIIIRTDNRTVSEIVVGILEQLPVDLVPASRDIDGESP